MNQRLFFSLSLLCTFCFSSLAASATLKISLRSYCFLFLIKIFFHLLNLFSLTGGRLGEDEKPNFPNPIHCAHFIYFIPNSFLLSPSSLLLLQSSSCFGFCCFRDKSSNKQNDFPFLGPLSNWDVSFSLLRLLHVKTTPLMLMFRGIPLLMSRNKPRDCFHQGKDFGESIVPLLQISEDVSPV